MRRLLIGAAILAASYSGASAHTWFFYDWASLTCITSDLSADAFIREQNNEYPGVTVARDTDADGNVTHVMITVPPNNTTDKDDTEYDMFTRMAACQDFQKSQDASDPNSDLN